MDYYDYMDLDSYMNGYSNSVNGQLVWQIIAIVLAVVGGLVIYFIFLNKEQGEKTNKFVKKIHELLNFKLLVLEPILKITYVILAIYLTLNSFSYIAVSFLLFLMQLVLGNLMLRIVYEGLILLIKICNNTSEISKSLKK